MILLTLRDLQYRAVRFLLVIVGTSVVFALLLLMTGLAGQFHREPALTVERFGAGAWVLPAGSSSPFTSGATLDPALAEQVEGGGRADPFIAARSTIWLDDVPQQAILVGHVPGGLGAPPVVEGSPATERWQVVLDESTGRSVGEVVRIGSRPYRVTGLSSDTTLFAGLPLAFMTLEDAQILVFRGRQVASGILTAGTPSAVPDKTAVLGDAAVAEDARRPLEQALRSINLIRALLWVVSAMIIGGLIYLSSMDRRRDFAVLKAVGASTRGLLGGLGAQGVLVAIAAAAIASGVQLLLAPAFPMKVDISVAARVQLPIVAAVIALLASLAGMRRVARTDPASAFSGPGG